MPDVAEGRSYGDYLREARERKGIDLVSMARVLHIRPDIVGAIENADFNKMPAHGYSKNMVRAYARQMGLDESRISQLYAQERDAFDGIPSSRGARPSPARSDARSRRLNEPSQRISASRSVRSGARSQSLSRSTGVPEKRDDRRASRPVPERSSSFSDLMGSFGRSSTPKQSMVRSSFTQGGRSPHGASRAPRSGSFNAPSLPALNLPVILAVVGAVLVIIIAVVLLNGGKQSVSDVPDIPISGLTDTSATDETSQVPQLEAAPSSAVFSFSVEEGGQSWISVTLDGSSTPAYAAVAEGPVSEDFEVTGTLTFQTANIAPVTLTVDGEEVTPVADSSGMYTYTVDFPSILAKWKQDHGIDDAASSSSSSSASSSAASSSAATSSSSSASSSSQS